MQLSVFGHSLDRDLATEDSFRLSSTIDCEAPWLAAFTLGPGLLAVLVISGVIQPPQFVRLRLGLFVSRLGVSLSRAGGPITLALHRLTARGLDRVPRLRAPRPHRDRRCPRDDNRPVISALGANLSLAILRKPRVRLLDPPCDLASTLSRSLASAFSLLSPSLCTLHCPLMFLSVLPLAASRLRCLPSPSPSFLPPPSSRVDRFPSLRSIEDVARL